MFSAPISPIPSLPFHFMTLSLFPSFLFPHLRHTHYPSYSYERAPYPPCSVFYFIQASPLQRLILSLRFRFTLLIFSRTSLYPSLFFTGLHSRCIIHFPCFAAQCFVIKRPTAFQLPIRYMACCNQIVSVQPVSLSSFVLPAYSFFRTLPVSPYQCTSSRQLYQPIAHSACS